MELDQLQDILGSGRFSLLVGEFESECLECKGQPYRLETDEQKLELSRDVTGMANSKGGIILIGCATEKDSTHGADRIDRIRPFPRSMADITRLDQVLSDWVWPTFDRLKIEWFPSEDDSEKGIVAIVVPAAEGSERPFLVAKTLFLGTRRIEILFGLCERKNDSVRHSSVERIHGLLRDGLRFDQEVRDGFQSLQESLETLRSYQAQEGSHARRVKEFDEQLAEALSAVGLNNKPVFAISAWPRRILDLGELFTSKESELVKLIEKPPEIRSSGFKILSGQGSRIVRGGIRRSVTAGFRLLELSRSGIMIYVSEGDQDGLCWSRNEKQADWNLINQLALVESTYLFCLLFERVCQLCLQEGDEVVYDLRLLRMDRNGENCRLESGMLDRYGSGFVFKSPEGSGVFTISARSGIESAARVAFLLLASLYSWFGIEEERVPYSRETAEEGQTIAEETLADQ
ncbi:MAG: hypothetical protein ABJC13_18490 [Acidobacteriota bacterium]